MTKDKTLIAVLVFSFMLTSMSDASSKLFNLARKINRGRRIETVITEFTNQREMKRRKVSAGGLEVTKKNTQVKNPYFLTRSGEKGFDDLYKQLLSRKPMPLRFVGVKTTGVACRFGCPARQPLQKNVVFTERLYDLICLGFRECKRCKPLSYNSTRDVTDSFITSVEKSTFPEKKAVSSQKDAKNWFLQTHSADLQKYVNTKRVNAILTNEHLPRSDFKRVLTYQRYWTSIGAMVACFSTNGLCLLEFTDRRMLEAELMLLVRKYKSYFKFASSSLSKKLCSELDEYFKGERSKFTIPIDRNGSEFQLSAWMALGQIPFGTTSTYKKQAQAIDRPNAMRPIANAHGKNCISILIPCHRVIGEDGKLTGYGGGLFRKQFLLDLERNTLNGWKSSTNQSTVIPLNGNVDRNSSLTKYFLVKN